MGASSGAGRLAGQVVIVTGAAGGIGRAVCVAAAREGASIVAADRSPDGVEATLQELRALAPGEGAPAHRGSLIDVRSEDDNRRLVAEALGGFGRIDALVACAGILRKPGTPPRPMVRVDMEEWELVLGINLTGIFLSNREVLPVMLRQKRGQIINLSSVSGLEGRAHDAPYCASKFGVIGFSQAVADEVRSRGVKVQAVCPHAVLTPMWQQNHPIPPPGDALPPERIADLIVFMLTQPQDVVLVGPVVAPLGARPTKDKR